MLHLVLVEAALETVPPSIQSHPSAVRNARKRKKKPAETLLDRSLHHAAMLRLPNGERRGRPDIVHFCLLDALGSPLNKEGGLKVWASTVGRYSIQVAPETRLPRDCNRFNSLMEQLFNEGKVPLNANKPLLLLKHENLQSLMRRINPSETIALTSHGKPSSFNEICEGLAKEEQGAVLVGAYPSGPMSNETLSVASDAFSIYPEPLEAWVVTSRLIYAYERAIASTTRG